MGPDRIKVTQSKQVAIIIPTGALDTTWAKAMKRVLEELLDAGKTRFVVDLRGVTYLDSAGLGELVRGMKRAREAGGDLRVCGLRGEAAKIFELTRLSQQMGVYRTRKDAVASWGKRVGKGI